MKEAIDIKKLETFLWKGRKFLNENGEYVQNEQRMVDMSEADLRHAYEHCKTMLYNNDNRHPGRYKLLEIIQKQKEKCGAELFLRYLKQEKDIERFSLTESILNFKKKNEEVFKVRTVFLKESLNVPARFEDIPVNTVLDGCLDRLGAFNKKHITRALILRQGVWLTAQESIDLTEKNVNNEIIDKLTVIRDRLDLKDVERLHINSKGLSYTELRAMITLKPNKKYIDLTTVQLETLRNKMLFILEESVNRHINSWLTRMKQIEQVAEYLGLSL